MVKQNTIIFTPVNTPLLNGVEGEVHYDSVAKELKLNNGTAHYDTVGGGQRLHAFMFM